MILLWGRRDTHWRTPFFGPSHPKERRPSDLHRADKTLKQSVQIQSKHGGMPRAIAFRKVLGSRLGRASGRRVANIKWHSRGAPALLAGTELRPPARKI